MSTQTGFSPSSIIITRCFARDAGLNIFIIFEKFFCTLYLLY